MDVFGKAALDYLAKTHAPEILVESKTMEDDVIPVAHLFRTFEEMPQVEQSALALAKGKVLDVGGGVGSHSLYLQGRGMDVVMNDISEGLCTVAQKRGVQDVLLADFFTHSFESKFDTILFMMNGIGIGGTFAKLKQTLEKCQSLLNPGGQILFDSTDIAFCYQDEDGSLMIPLNTKYIGFVEFKLKYKNIVDPWFKWAYYDFEKLAEYLPKGAHLEVILEDGPAYSGRITFAD